MFVVVDKPSDSFRCKAVNLIKNFLKKLKNETGKNKFISWFFCNIIIALIPLIAVIVFRSFASKNILESAGDFPEALFFSLMVCATTINDLRMSKNKDDFQTSFQLLEYFLFLGVIGFAMLYGVLKFINIQEPTKTLTPTQFYTILISMIASIIVSIIAQIFINLVSKTANVEG